MKKFLHVLLSLAFLSSVSYAEYFNLKAKNITGDGTGSISGFTNIDQMSSDNVIITGGTISNTTVSGITLDNATISGSSLDNSIIGANIPAITTTTLLTATAQATLQAGGKVESDQAFYFGTPMMYGCSYNSTTAQMICATDNGTSSGDTYPMYAFRAGVATALDNGQEVFAVQDNTTSIWKITKEGNVTQTGTLTASQFISDCSSSDNTCYINASNLGDPASATEGDCYYNTTSNTWLCYNGATWAASTATSLDWDGLLNKHALPQTKDFVIKGYATGDNNTLLWKADQAQTLVQMDCITGGTDNVTITLLECNSSGASCGTTGLDVTATSTGGSDSTPTDPNVAENAWMRIQVSNIQGSATHVACSIRYTVAMP